MYDPTVTAAKVQAASDAQIQAAVAKGDQPWALVYHTHEQVQDAIGHFNDLREPDTGQLKRPLSIEESRFISNERKLSALDFQYWSSRYARIIGWDRQPTTFIPNVAQQIILDLWAESERQGHPIWMQQLKARQLGVSTLSELGVQHRFQFHAYSDCVVASADPDKSVKLAGMIKYSLEQQPWWLLPKVTAIKHFIPAEFGELHSRLRIEAGNQHTGLARGSTPNVVHLTECASWQFPEELIEGALFPAIHDTPDVFGILESTAEGPGWWKKKWESTKQFYPQGISKLRPVFLPWYVGTDIYPTESDLRRRPIPPDWQPKDRTLDHARKARAYVLSDPLLFQHLAKGDRDWQVPLSQLWWWEIEYDQAKFDKRLHHFLAEYASDDFSCFQSSNVPVIDPEVLLAYQQRVREPVGVYTIIGPDIPPTLVAPMRQWDSSKPPITVRTGEVLANFDVVYQLVPITFEGYPQLDHGMKLLVYEEPDSHYRYGAGIDCAEGLGLDGSTLQVLRESTGDRPPAQVAEWWSNYVTAFQLWPICLAVGCWYSVYNLNAGRRTQIRQAIEVMTNGASLQNELMKRGWSNFHPWQYTDVRRPKQEGEVNRLGVVTNFWWRANMMDMLLTCLGEEAIEIWSPYLIDELTTLERAQGTHKVEHAPDALDDRVIALGHILLSLHMRKPAMLQHGRKRLDYAAGLELPAQTHPVWSAPDQAKAIHLGRFASKAVEAGAAMMRSHVPSAGRPVVQQVQYDQAGRPYLGKLTTHEPRTLASLLRGRR